MARKFLVLALVLMTLFGMYSAKAYAANDDDVIGTDDEGEEVFAAAPDVAVEAPSAGGPAASTGAAYGPSASAEGPSSGAAVLKVSALGAVGAAGIAAFFY